LFPQKQCNIAVEKVVKHTLNMPHYYIFRSISITDSISIYRVI